MVWLGGVQGAESHKGQRCKGGPGCRSQEGDVRAKAKGKRGGKKKYIAL